MGLLKIADLFVNLGVKGGDDLKRTLNQTKGTLGEISTQGLAVKAGLLGAMYGLEQMMQSSAKAGTDLTRFAANTGLPIRKLQEFAFATKQAGGTAEGLKSSVMHIQSAIKEMTLTGAQPRFLGIMTQYIGALDKKMLKDPFYLLQKMQDFVQKAPADL